MNRANRPRLSRISGSSVASKLLGRAGDGSTLTLDFTTGILDPRLTFTRSGNTATFVNSSGLIQPINANLPRFEYDPTTLEAKGLLIEAAATTLNQWGEDYTQAYWTKVGSSISATSIAGPDNVSTATRRIVENAATDQHGIRRGITTTAGLTYTLSVFVKPGSYNSFGIEVYWSAAYNAKAEVTSISGNTATVTSPSGVNATLTRTVLSASGWYRYAMTFTHPVAVGAATPDFNVFVKQINPYAGNSTNYMDVYGVMVEASTAASSYVPTPSAATQTRNVDTAIIAAGANFTSWYPAGTRGTFYADWFGGVRAGASGSTNRTVLSTDDVSTRHLHLFQTAAAGNLRVADFGGTNNVTTANTLTSGAKTKGAFSYNGSTANVCLNGGTVATGSSLAFSATPTWLAIGGTSTNGTSITDANVLLNNSIRTIKYWPSVLPNSTLQALTA